jgi:NAD(P)H-dependent FMN reductase
MSKKVIAFGASNSTTSINKRLAGYTASLLNNVTIEILDLNDFELPLFSVDREKELGSPELAQLFFNKMAEADAIIISFAEHNGSYSAAYKNIFDWASRINPKVYHDKPMIVLSTSPGKGGAQRVLNHATSSLPYLGGHVIGQLSVPSFGDVFDLEKGCLTDPLLIQELRSLTDELVTKM